MFNSGLDCSLNVQSLYAKVELSEQVVLKEGKAGKRKVSDTGRDSISSDHTRSTTSATEESVNEVLENPLKVLVIRRKNKLPFPRILKSDIRRLYANMFANGFNSHNAALYRSFYDTCWTRDSSLCITVEAPSEFIVVPASASPTAEMVGVEMNVMFMMQNYRNYPDLVLRISEPELDMKRGSACCRLACDYSIQATSIQPKWIDKLANECREHLNRGECFTEEHIKSGEDGLLTPWIKPVPFMVQGKLVVHINADKKIELISCFGKPC